MRRICLLAILIALGVQTNPAPAQNVKEALQVIPDDALGFLLVNRIEETRLKIEGVAKRVKAPLESDHLLPLLKSAKGLNGKGSLAIAVFAGGADDPKPTPVLFFPVSDYKAFLGQFEPGDPSATITDITFPFPGKPTKMVAGKRGSFAVVTLAGRRDLLEIALKSGKSVAAWAEPLEAWLSANDASGVLTPKGLQVVTALVRKGLGEIKGKMVAGPAEVPFLGQWLEGVGGFVKTVEADVTHVALGARIDAAGNVQLGLQSLFAKGSGFAKAGAASKVLPGGPLAGLPAGPFAFALGGSMSEKLMQGMMSLNLEMLKAMAKDVPRDQMKKLEEAYAQMGKGLQGMGFVMQVGKEGDLPFNNLIGVMHVDNASDHMERYVKGVRVMNEVLKGLEIPFLPAQEIKKVMVNGRDALETTMDFGRGMALPEEQKALMEKIFGPGGKLTFSQAALNDRTILLRYTPASGLKDLLGAKGGLAEDPEIAKTAALLPEGSQWAFYLHPQGTAQWIGQLVGSFAPMPVAMPGFPKTAPVGIGFKLAETGLEIRAVIPASVLDGIGTLPKGKKRELE